MSTQRTVNIFFALCLLFIISCRERTPAIVDPIIVTTLRPGFNEFEMEFDGLMRDITVQLPVGFQQETFYPVVFFFHGLGGNKGFGESVLGRLVDEENFIGIYPQGHLNSWNTGGNEIPSTADDVGLTLHILNWFKTEISVDEDRIYSMGYSNGGAVDLLGEIVRIASGMRVDAFSGQYLFAPLGITNYQWQTLRPSGIIATHGDIYISPQDLAKFGYLFLNNGVWNGNRVISKAWVKKSTEEFISLPFLSWADAYGYLWWQKIYSHNNQAIESIKAIGWGGQEVIIIRDLNMVVVFTGANYVSDPPCDEIIVRFILPALL